MLEVYRKYIRSLQKSSKSTNSRILGISGGKINPWLCESDTHYSKKNVIKLQPSRENWILVSAQTALNAVVLKIKLAILVKLTPLFYPQIEGN